MDYKFPPQTKLNHLSKLKSCFLPNIPLDSLVPLSSIFFVRIQRRGKQRMASSVLLSSTFSSSYPRTNNPTPRFLSRLLNPTKSSSQKFLQSIHPDLPSISLSFSRNLVHRTSIADGDADAPNSDGLPLVGEDVAAFQLEDQKITSWVCLVLTLSAVFYVLNVAWIDNSTGFGKAFLKTVSCLSKRHEVIMFILILIFGTVHSGLASLREVGEKLIGERAFRVLFAAFSFPLAFSVYVYFINHRYDGVQLWQLQSVPAIHQLVWLSSFISFILLSPSTFNLVELTAVDKPRMHLWETGIIRITRHPQVVGQIFWCLGHTVWIGNSVAVAASLGLIGYHLFSVWNGDRRLAMRFGEAFKVVKRRTSVIPFAAVLDGRQKLPKDYYKEFLRLPYFTITAIAIAVYFGHPLAQAASLGLNW